MGKEASPLAPPDAPGQRESVCRKERASKVRVRMERNEKVEVKQALTTPARPTYKRNHNKVKRGVVPVPKKPVAKKKPAKKKPSKKSTKLEHPLSALPGPSTPGEEEDKEVINRILKKGQFRPKPAKNKSQRKKKVAKKTTKKPA